VVCSDCQGKGECFCHDRDWHPKQEQQEVRVAS
jgi:hypothetical protein